MEARTFEMEFAKFIERFRQDIRDAFIEDTFHKREILSITSLAGKCLRNWLTRSFQNYHEHRQKDYSGNHRGQICTSRDPVLRGWTKLFRDGAGFHIVEAPHLAVFSREQFCWTAF